MSNKLQEDKSKMRSLSLNEEDDKALIEIGGGSRTAAVKELMELYRILNKAKGTKSIQDLKYKLASMVESYNGGQL